MTNLFSISTSGQPGGGGKTTAIQFVEAGLAFSGRVVRVIDADPANAGYTESANDSVKLRALIRTGEVCTFISQAADEGACLLIDCGAGVLSADSDFVNALRDTYDGLRRAGYRHTTLLPVNSNKAWAEKPTVESIRRHETFGEVLICMTDVARTGKFPDWLPQLAVPIINTPVLATGFIDLRARAKVPLSSWLMGNDEDQVNAKAAFAKAAAKLVSSPQLAHLATADGLRRLQAIGALGLSNWTFNPSSAAEATDPVLQLLVSRTIALRQVVKDARSDPAHPYYAVIAADKSIEEAMRTAKLRFPPTDFGVAKVAAAA